jgi:hypothetical protein
LGPGHRLNTGFAAADRAALAALEIHEVATSSI